MIKLKQLIESNISENAISNRKKWVSKIANEYAEKLSKQHTENIDKKIATEIQKEYTNQFNDEKKRVASIEKETGKVEEPIVPDRNEIAREIILKYSKHRESNDASTINYKLMKLISVFTEKGMVEEKARKLCKSIFSIASNMSLIDTLYMYVEYSTRMKLSEYIGKMTTFDSLLKDINEIIYTTSETVKNKLNEDPFFFENIDGDYGDALAKEINKEKNIDKNKKIPTSFIKEELSQLMDIEDGAPFITLIFSDVKWKAGYTNELYINGKIISIKNRNAPLIVNTDQDAIACLNSLIVGFNKFNEKYDLKINVSTKASDWNILQSYRWLGDIMAEKFTASCVPRNDVINMITESFYHIHNTSYAKDNLFKLFNVYVGNKTFNPVRFIEQYFFFAMKEYINTNNISHIMFKNDKLGKFYIVDCGDFKEVYALNDKLTLRPPKFDSPILTSHVFNMLLK